MNTEKVNNQTQPDTGAKRSQFHSSAGLEALARRFERRAREWDNSEATHKTIEIGEAMAMLYRELAHDLRAEMGSASNEEWDSRLRKTLRNL